MIALRHLPTLLNVDVDEQKPVNRNGNIRSPVSVIHARVQHHIGDVSVFPFGEHFLTFDATFFSLARLFSLALICRLLLDLLRAQSTSILNVLLANQACPAFCVFVRIIYTVNTEKSETMKLATFPLFILSIR